MADHVPPAAAAGRLVGALWPAVVAAVAPPPLPAGLAAALLRGDAPGPAVLGAALQAAATEPGPLGAALAAHAAAAPWAQVYPLTCQPYAALLGEDPLLHLDCRAALAAGPWPRRPLQALAAGPDPAAAAALVDGLRALRAELAVILERIAGVRARRGHLGMHVVQAEAFEMVRLLQAPAPGRQGIDLGCGDGELVAALRAAGWAMAGSEVEGAAPDTLLGVPERPAYGLVTATGFMEPGAFAWPGEGHSVPLYAARHPELVQAAARLLLPDGLLVVRNLNYPLPFAAAAAAAGLQLLPCAMPLCTPHYGGRSAAWRRLPD